MLVNFVLSLARVQEHFQQRNTDCKAFANKIETKFVSIITCFNVD